MNTKTARIRTLDEQMRWVVVSDQEVLSGLQMLPDGGSASFRASTSVQPLSREDSGKLTSSTYRARHLGTVRRTVDRESSERVVISYEFDGDGETVAITFEASHEQDLRLLNASEHMMDDLIYR